MDLLGLTAGLKPGSCWAYNYETSFRVIRFFQISKTPGLFVELVDEDGVMHRHDMLVVRTAIENGEFQPCK